MPVADELARRLRAEILDRGPMRFSRWVERALYEPELGFYEGRGSAGGRRGDFVTSVETGPLFAAMVGEWLDRRWRELGCPDPFRVAEAAAGVGTLWRGVNRARPACFEALRWTLVERSAALRDAHARLPAGSWSSSPDLPEHRQHVVLANELLDNLVFDIGERVDDGWVEWRVDVADVGFTFVRGARVPDHSPLGQVRPGFAVGAVVPIATGAVAWLTRARGLASTVLTFDYAASTAELGDRGPAGWLRTYAGHVRGHDPLAAPGSVDITHDVPWDQLPAPCYRSTQADWLHELGLPERVEQARLAWQNRAGIGDLEAQFARSAVTEAGVLADPTGLGGFFVLEW